MTRSLALFLLFVTPMLLLLGCGDQPEPAWDIVPLHTYDVRGKVVAIQPDGKTLSIHHEEIPDFVHVSGEAKGMAEMVMDLEVAEGEDISAIKPGDKISFTFEGYWEPLPAKWWIENIQTLPADTKLNLKDTGGDSHEGHKHDHEDHAH